MMTPEHGLTMHQLAAMVRESVKKMTPAEKAEARKHLDAEFIRFTDADHDFLRQIGVTARLREARA